MPVPSICDKYLIVASAGALCKCKHNDPIIYKPYKGHVVGTGLIPHVNPGRITFLEKYNCTMRIIILYLLFITAHITNGNMRLQHIQMRPVQIQIMTTVCSRRSAVRN